MAWIVRSTDPECLDEQVAGGKGSSLARLLQLGANVPPFFVVPVDAYGKLGQAPLESEFTEELGEALAGLRSAEGVAVRSSAIGEDAADRSYAGIYHTSLDAHGFDAVLNAVRECWSSYQSPAAANYRALHGDEGGGMAVVVQEMVHGEWSGVSFTANPVNLALSEALINAAPGLGESLVAGEVNPEEITAATADGRVLKRVAGSQAGALPEEAVAAVWQKSKEIAEALHFPQDVEWTWRAGELFVLQSRPITTIADVFYSRYLETWKDDPEADPDTPQRVWSRLLADETWVSPISPLFYNVHNSAPGRVAFIRLHGDQVKLPPDIFKYHRATAYADIRMIRRMYEFQPRLARIQGVLNFLPASMREDFANRPWRWRGRLHRSLSYEFRQREMRSFFSNYKYVQNQWPDFVSRSDKWLDMDLDTLTLEELRAHQGEVGLAMAAVGPACGIAVLSHATDLHLLLTGLLDRWCRDMGSDGENLYARISSGLENSETLQEADSLWEIAQDIRALGADVAESAQAGSFAEFKGGVAGSTDGERVVERFEKFWRAHRHLGSTYKDLIWPRWGDDVDECFNVVKGYLGSAAIRPSEVNRRSGEARRAAQAQILASLSGPQAPLRRSILRRLFRYNEIYMAERDNHRYYFDRNWYELRRIYRSYGARLAATGVLKERDEVFFLGIAEIEAGLAGALTGEEAGARVAVRRRVWEKTLHEQGPKFLRGWAPYEESVFAQSGEEAALLEGIAGSPGTAVGTARIVYDVRELVDVKDGDILVTRQTDPSWTSVFGRIGGLVLETGGVLAHGMSLCREYGLPCVTAVEQATVRIPDGSKIEVVGNEGKIRVLSR
jgi:pyruvate,water dikinase